MKTSLTLTSATIAFSNKIRIGLAILAISGFTSFNAKAQENYKPKYNTIAHKSFAISGETSYLSLKTLDTIIDSSKKVITKKIIQKKKPKNYP